MSAPRGVVCTALACVLLGLPACKAEQRAAPAPRDAAVALDPPAHEPLAPAQPGALIAKHRGPTVKALVGALEGAEPLLSARAPEGALLSARAPEGALLSARAPEGALRPQDKPLEANRVLALKARAALTLDFAKGARVVLHGPAQVVVAPAAEEALLLKHGTLSIDLPPSAPTPDSGFWLATPSVRLELVRSGRLVVRAFSDGSSMVFVVSGSARVAAATTEAPAEPLTPGQGLYVALGGRSERTRLEPLALEEALLRGLKLPERPGSEERVRTGLDPSLTELVAQVAADVARERSLVLAHRQQIGTPAALSAQAAVASHAANLAHQRARLRTLLSQRAAARLLPVASPDDVLGQRAEQLLVR